MDEENQETSEPKTENVESGDASNSGGKNGLIITIVVIALIALAGGIYFLSKKSSGSLNTTTDTNSVVSTPASTSNQPVKELTVSGKEFSFSPAKLTVNKGDRVKLV